MARLRSLKIKRIVVAVDASPTSRAAIHAAANLAATWHAEVCGIFIEDANLLRWASLPFARAVNALAPSDRSVAPSEVERQLRAQARRAHQELERAVLHLPVHRSFRVARGSVSDLLLDSLLDADLVTMGKGRPGDRLGSTARAMMTGVRGHVLFTPLVARIPAPTAILFDASAAAREALSAALDIAKGRPLTVMCVAETEKERRALERAAHDLLQARGVEARAVGLTPSEARRIHQVALDMGAQVLVLPGPGHTLGVDDLATAVSAFPGPVLVVASRDPADATNAS